MIEKVADHVDEVAASFLAAAPLVVVASGTPATCSGSTGAGGWVRDPEVLALWDDPSARAIVLGLSELVDAARAACRREV